MAFLQEKDTEHIKKMFSELDNEVTLSFFTQEIECPYCGETEQILQELSAIDNKIILKTYDFKVDKDSVSKYRIDKIPAIAVEGKQDYGIRFYGIPSGYEFSSLLDDIVDVSKAESGLTPASKTLLKEIDKPLHLQVFVTPTCPHCPQAVKLAHKMAIENPMITADMIEATEFPQLSMKYNVRGVPRTIVGQDFPIEGGLPENIFIKKIIESSKIN